MADDNSAQIIGIILSAILSAFGSGFACFIKYGTRITMIEQKLEDAQLVTLHPRLSLVESAVQEIKTALVDLKMLPRISTQLEAMNESLTQLVPRREHEARWKDADRRIETVENDVRNLKK